MHFTPTGAAQPQRSATTRKVLPLRCSSLGSTRQHGRRRRPPTAVAFSTCCREHTCHHVCQWLRHLFAQTRSVPSSPPPPIVAAQGSAEQPHQPCPQHSEQPEQGYHPRASRPRCRIAEHAMADRSVVGLCTTPRVAPGRGVVFSCPAGQRMRIYLPHKVPARCRLDRWG
jgi:hypothetical protein